MILELFPVVRKTGIPTLNSDVTGNLVCFTAKTGDNQLGDFIGLVPLDLRKPACVDLRFAEHLGLDDYRRSDSARSGRIDEEIMLSCVGLSLIHI